MQRIRRPAENNYQFSQSHPVTSIDTPSSSQNKIDNSHQHKHDEHKTNNRINSKENHGNKHHNNKTLIKQTTDQTKLQIVLPDLSNNSNDK